MIIIELEECGISIAVVEGPSRIESSGVTLSPSVKSSSKIKSLHWDMGRLCTYPTVSGSVGGKLSVDNWTLMLYMSRPTSQHEHV